MLWRSGGVPELPPLASHGVPAKLSVDRWQLDRLTCTLPGRPRHPAQRWSAWPTLLDQLHHQLHPVFTDHYLKALEGLSPQHALNDPSLRTTVEISLNADRAELKSLVIISPSQQALFDVIVLESLLVAFAKLPKIVHHAPSSLIRMRWDLSRNPIFACSTYSATPLWP